MFQRTIAIGDIHGCSIALAALIESISPQADDTIITLGDYVDRGIDSKGVLDLLIGLADRCRLVPLLGNHDEMMLHARDGRGDFQFWLNCGGDAALDSYGSTRSLELIPAAHFRFLEHCLALFENDKYFFVHANYRPDSPLDRQDGETLRWLSLRDFVPGPHCRGKIAVVGHTPQPDVLEIGHLICLDTGCCNGGWLTAMELPSGRIWQVDEKGRPRS
jgi:serine/threonine protein phosphatase 1